MVNTNAIVDNGYDHVVTLKNSIDELLYKPDNNIAMWDNIIRYRDYITPYLSTKLMVWVDQVDVSCGHLYKVIQCSKHLMIEDVNFIIHKMYLGQHVHNYAVVNIIENNYPQYMNYLNYDELFALDLANLSNVESYYDIVEWMQVDDDVARNIISRVSVHGSLSMLADHLNTMNNYRRQYFVWYGDNSLKDLLNKSFIRVEDIVQVYGLENDALLGVSI